MPGWKSPQDAEHYPSAPAPAGPVHIGKRPSHTPPHVNIYAGLEFVSNQVENVSAQMRDVLLELAEMKSLMKDLMTRVESSDRSE